MITHTIPLPPIPAETVIVAITSAGQEIAATLSRELGGMTMSRAEIVGHGLPVGCRALIFVGAMGVCVRTIAPLLNDKHTDPAIVCVDTCGQWAIAVASGHIGGANELTERVARILGATPVVTTRSDNAGLWALDTLDRRFGWRVDAIPPVMNAAIFAFVDGKTTGLLLDVNDEGTQWLRQTMPSHVILINSMEEAEARMCKAIVAVTPRIMAAPAGIPTIFFRPQCVALGVGCRRDAQSQGVADYIAETLKTEGISPLSICKIATVDIKAAEPLISAVAERFNAPLTIYPASELESVEVPNPSERVKEATGSPSVAEASAILAADGGNLLIDKQKGKIAEGSDFTFAAALLRSASASLPAGHIEIVGAGPGDPELISVRGKRLLEEADLILYAGSLVPERLTHYAKPGATVRSSASMTLDEQFALMKEHYDRGHLVVRLHTGDPCIYGAIQEQMAFFDLHGMDYHITPGISSFQAAAAALRSQFTIPERVQSIILTRGEGRTPMPEREQLAKLARSRSTMCIYLSAAIVDEVQAQLLEEYPPETPVAACYKLTWPGEERIYRGQLSDLAKIVHDNNLTLTTLLVVGDAIDNRQGLSKLYDANFSHLFRP